MHVKSGFSTSMMGKIPKSSIRETNARRYHVESTPILWAGQRKSNKEQLTVAMKLREDLRTLGYSENSNM